uniref:Cyclin-dependent kinase inhibitor n=1 Tax=Syphacia muris TaxID=451379 RepID=A0A0N5ABR7_9BILA
MSDESLLEIKDAESFFVRRFPSREEELAANRSSNELVLEDGPSSSGKNSPANASDSRLVRVSEVTEDPECFAAVKDVDNSSLNDAPCGSEFLRFDDTPYVPRKRGNCVFN